MVRMYSRDYAIKVDFKVFPTQFPFDTKVVFVNGESYLVMNFQKLQNYQKLIFQRDLQLVLKNQQVFPKEDLHRWS